MPAATNFAFLAESGGQQVLKNANLPHRVLVKFLSDFNLEPFYKARTLWWALCSTSSERRRREVTDQYLVAKRKVLKALAKACANQARLAALRSRNSCFVSVLAGGSLLIG